MSWIEVDVDGRKTRVAVARSGNTVWVSSAGVTKRLAPESAAPSSPVSGERELRAPMTGRVAKVTAAVGAKVVVGESLVVLEAMKMEHALTAPFDGIVTELAVQEGDQVTEGSMLARVRRETT